MWQFHTLQRNFATIIHNDIENNDTKINTLPDKLSSTSLKHVRIRLHLHSRISRLCINDVTATENNRENSLRATSQLCQK